MNRGDLVSVALQGAHGKPRPALVVQSDLFGELGSVTVLPVTSALLGAGLLRIEVEPNAENGLTRRSQIMVDKAQTPPRSKIGGVIGRLDPTTLLAVTRALALFFGMAPAPAAGTVLAHHT